MEQKSLKQLIKIVKTGKTTEVKTAQKEIEKRCNKVKHPLDRIQRKEYEIFVKEIKEFDQIKNINNKMYFINTLKWPFLTIGEENFPIFADFIIRRIQNPTGKIRQAIINSVDWLLIAAAFDLRPIFDNPTKEQLEEISQNKERFYFLTSQVMKLLDKYNKPRFNKYKYVSSMPPSIYKSLQKLVTEHLLPTEHQEKVYDECEKEASSLASGNYRSK